MRTVPEAYKPSRKSGYRNVLIGMNMPSHTQGQAMVRIISVEQQTVAVRIPTHSSPRHTTDTQILPIILRKGDEQAQAGDQPDDDDILT